MSQPQELQFNSRPSDEIDLGHLLGVLIDHRFYILGAAVISGVLAAIYAHLVAPVYRADALIQIEASRSNSPLAEVSSFLGDTPPSQSEIEIIRSRMVLGRAVDILALDVTVEPVRIPILGGLVDRFSIERPSYAENWRYAWSGESIAMGNLDVAPAYIGESFVLRVIDSRHYGVYHDGRYLGAGVVGETVSMLMGGLSVRVDAIKAPPGAEFGVSRISRVLAINNLRESLRISEQGKETGILAWAITNQDPVRAENVLQTIADIYVSQNIQRQSEEARKSLAFLKEQLPGVKNELTVAEEKLNAYRTDRDSIDLPLQTQSILERLVNIEGRLNELAFSEAEISRRFTRSHPTYAALIDKMDQLEEDRIAIESEIGELPQTQQQVLRLQRDLAVNQEIYVQLLNKIQEMQIAEASTVGNVRILDMARVFPEPVSPRKMLIVIMAVMVGGLGGTGMVLLRTALHRGVENQEELEAIGLPVYATIPMSEEQQNLGGRKQRKTEQPVRLLAQWNPADTSVEAIRSLRTSMHFGMTDSTNNCVMITGPSPEIGKSFISANLAAVYAQVGQRVLLVDGDMRKGHIHKLFSDRAERGLSEYLSNRLRFRDVIRPVDEIEGLSYIARGVAPPNPAELLASDKFAEFLQLLSRKYDIVVLDSPPVLAVTDAAIIGKRAGMVLMVARFRLNPTKEVELAAQRLSTAGVRVTGAVLNAVERTAACRYGYGYYSYSYQ